MEDDIRKRGITYEETLSTGVKKVITNPSIKDRVAVSKQMNAILDKLGISPDTNISSGEMNCNVHPGGAYRLSEYCARRKNKGLPRTKAAN